MFARKNIQKKVIPARITGLSLFVLVVLLLGSCAVTGAPPEETSVNENLPAEVFQEDEDNQVFLPQVSGGNPTDQIDEPEIFDGERAYQDVLTQLDFGPRVVGSEAHQQFLDWAASELVDTGWTVELQETTMLEHPIKNLSAKRTEASGKPVVVIGAHYDSRMLADQDPDPEKRDEPVPAANDGASGTAILLELARILPENLNVDIWLVFFDAEDNGNIPGWDWILGSRAFVDALEITPEAAVIVDLVGDADLNIYKERTSNQELTSEIWSKASELGYSQFINALKYSVLDDHTPFLQAGIPAVDIIDFDYPYWHTTQDTADKVSAESLEAVGTTVAAWLAEKYPPIE
ncbi:MAG: M28 family peptidase [Chloroflexi bacterium]|nr:MAG: M28 family peptidase [Chloroflexota bacterium]